MYYVGGLLRHRGKAFPLGDDSRFFNPLCCPPQKRGPLRPEAKLLIREARARNPNRLFSALAVEILLPASGNRSNYSHDVRFFVDAPRSSRYIAYLRHATTFVLADPYLGSIHRSSPGHCSQAGLSTYLPTANHFQLMTDASPSSLWL